jgi:hypothetical protein
MIGYYLAIGNATGEEYPDAPRKVIRFYWNLTLGAAVPFVAAVTSILNNNSIPFELKVPTLANAFVYQTSRAWLGVGGGS